MAQPEPSTTRSDPRLQGRMVSAERQTRKEREVGTGRNSRSQGGNQVRSQNLQVWQCLPLLGQESAEDRGVLRHGCGEGGAV